MSCLFYCCTKRTYFYAFLFLYRFFDNSSDHGMISSSKSAVSLFPVILVSMYSIYSYGFTLCPRCRSEFMGIADNIVRRVDPLQVERVFHRRCYQQTLSGWIFQNCARRVCWRKEYQMKIQLIDFDGRSPERAHANDDGADVFSPKDAGSCQS